MTEGTHTTTDQNTARMRELGAEAGRMAGSWVVDGNTSADTLRALVSDDYEFDVPAPLSGEWADGPLPREVLAEVGLSEDDDAADDMLSEYEQSYSDAYIAEAQRSAKAMLPTTVRDALAAVEYDPTTSYVVSVGTVQFSSAVRPFYESRDVLVFSSARIDSRQGDDDPMHIGNFRALDSDPGWSELRCASPYSDATYFALEMDGNAPDDLMAVITGLENYPVIDDEEMSKAEMELAGEHWDYYGRHDALVALAELLDIDVCDLDDTAAGLVDAHMTGEDRYPEYVDPSWFEFHPADIAADVFAAVVAWLSAEINHGQGELF
jgi:hypothetical protein